MNWRIQWALLLVWNFIVIVTAEGEPLFDDPPEEVEPPIEELITPIPSGDIEPVDVRVRISTLEGIDFDFVTFEEVIQRRYSNAMIITTRRSYAVLVTGMEITVRVFLSWDSNTRAELTVVITDAATQAGASEVSILSILVSGQSAWPVHSATSKYCIAGVDIGYYTPEVVSEIRTLTLNDIPSQRHRTVSISTICLHEHETTCVSDSTLAAGNNPLIPSNPPINIRYNYENASRLAMVHIHLTSPEADSDASYLSNKIKAHVTSSDLNIFQLIVCVDPTPNQPVSGGTNANELAFLVIGGAVLIIIGTVVFLKRKRFAASCHKLFSNPRARSELHSKQSTGHNPDQDEDLPEQTTDGWLDVAHPYMPTFPNTTVGGDTYAWERHSLDGVNYYYNTNTGRTRWDTPTDDENLASLAETLNNSTSDITHPDHEGGSKFETPERRTKIINKNRTPDAGSGNAPTRSTASTDRRTKASEIESPFSGRVSRNEPDASDQLSRTAFATSSDSIVEKRERLQQAMTHSDNDVNKETSDKKYQQNNSRKDIDRRFRSQSNPLKAVEQTVDKNAGKHASQSNSGHKQKKHRPTPSHHPDDESPC